jgi:hypothetical protein
MGNIRFGSHSTTPIVNGPSDHNVWYLMINDITAARSLTPLKQRTREVNNESHAVSASSEESNMGIFFTKTMKPKKFNSILCTFLNVFEVVSQLNVEV